MATRVYLETRFIFKFSVWHEQKLPMAARSLIALSLSTRQRTIDDCAVKIGIVGIDYIFVDYKHSKSGARRFVVASVVGEIKWRVA